MGFKKRFVLVCFIQSFDDDDYELESSCFCRERNRERLMPLVLEKKLRGDGKAFYISRNIERQRNDFQLQVSGLGKGSTRRKSENQY